MTAKEYLNQIHNYQIKYESQLEHIKDLRLLATSTGAIRYDKDKVQSSPNGDSMTNAVIKIIEAENKAYEIAIDLANKRQEITYKIINLDIGEYARLLCLRYVKGFKLEDVANEMHYSYEWTRHQHSKALDAFSERYPEIAEM